jgi:hypothetical protein
MTRKRIASRTEIVAIHAELAKVIKKMDGGLCEYHEGHSDFTVAKLVGCSEANVAGVRTEMFGKLRRPATSDEAARQEIMGLRRVPRRPEGALRPSRQLDVDKQGARRASPAHVEAGGAKK